MQATPLELHPGAEEDYLNSLAWYRDRNFSTIVTSSANRPGVGSRVIDLVEKPSNITSLNLNHHFAKRSLRHFAGVCLAYRKYVPLFCG
jgi:hypothetical protein